MKIKVLFLLFCFVCFSPLFVQGENIAVVETPLDVQQVEIEPFEPIILNPVYFASNPFFIELIYTGTDIRLDWRNNNNNLLFDGKQARTLNQPFEPIEIQHPDEILTQLRSDARNYITRVSPRLYTTTIDRLPNINWAQRNQTLESIPIEQLVLSESFFAPVVTNNRLVVRKKELSHWQNRANALLQLSQTSVSENWHQGGNNFFSLLGVVSGHFNYDNKKKMKWENSFEWRTGFNTVTNDTLRKAMTNDDIIRAISKFNVKATGNFFYSTSMDFQTHLFNNPRGINSLEMRARFLTPIRFNANIGVDYRRKNLSVAFSPLSFRFIYLTDTTTTSKGFFLNPNMFSIPTGENKLEEFGSRLVVGLTNYRPIRELTIRSTFNFYTNYEKVEIDWETVAELAINRFFSTRLMLNPRFDNTVILEKDDKAKVQMRQMLTVGFSYRFL